MLTNGNVEGVDSFVSCLGAVDEDVDWVVEIRPRVERPTAELDQKRGTEEHPAVEGNCFPVQEQILLPLLLCCRFHNWVQSPVPHEQSYQWVLRIPLFLTRNRHFGNDIQ